MPLNSAIACAPVAPSISGADTTVVGFVVFQGALGNHAIPIAGGGSIKPAAKNAKVSDKANFLTILIVHLVPVCISATGTLQATTVGAYVLRGPRSPYSRHLKGNVLFRRCNLCAGLGGVVTTNGQC